jgi:hypothetical protein
MASKSLKPKKTAKPKLDAHQRRMKWLQTIFVVISLLLIASMLLTAFIKL